jgi:hypothetical protein
MIKVLFRLTLLFLIIATILCYLPATRRYKDDTHLQYSFKYGLIESTQLVQTAFESPLDPHKVLGEDSTPNQQAKRIGEVTGSVLQIVMAANILAFTLSWIFSSPRRRRYPSQEITEKILRAHQNKSN